MKTFREELNTVMTLVGNVKYREMFKLEIFEIANISKIFNWFSSFKVLEFESAIRDKSETNKLIERFKENYESESYLKVKKRMKEHNEDLKSMIIPKPKPEETIQPEPIPKPKQTTPKEPSEELNYDLGCFLASMLDECLERNIVSNLRVYIY